MSPLNLLATCPRMYQPQHFSQISPVSTTSCGSDGYVSQIPIEPRSPLEFSPHYQTPYTSYNNQYWFQHSPPPADIATSGYQPVQPQYQWPHHQTSYIPPFPSVKMVKPELPLEYPNYSTKARRCIKCQCPNCLNEENGLRKPSSKKVHVCHYQGCDKVI